MPALPIVGGDANNWGTELNAWLQVAHNADGSSKYVYDVTFYGAKVDGTTDDTTAIQAAINAAQTAGGGIVLLGLGTSIVSSTLTISADNVHLVGRGRGSRLQAGATFPATQMLLVTGPSGANYRNGIVFMDFLLQNTATSAATAIELQSTYYAVIERVDIEGVYATNVYLNGSVGANTVFGAYTRIRDCHLGAVPSGGGSAGTGILSNNHEFWTVTDCTLNWFNSAGGIAIRVQSDSVSIRDCTFDACDTAIHLFFCNYTTIHGNHFDRGYTRFLYSNGAKYARIFGNNFETRSGSGASAVVVDNTGADSIFAENSFKPGTTWTNAVSESAGPTAATLYVNNDFGGLAVVRTNGIFRSNTGFNPLAALPTPAAPATTNATTGGTVAVGTYGVETTLVNAFGETLPSANGPTTTTTATSTIAVPAPDGKTPYGNATGYYVYMTQVNGATFTRQQAAGSPTPLGVNFVLSAPPSSGGAAPPGSNTTAGFTQPAVPASTVAYHNTFGVDCTVYITGGTVTAIAHNGVTTGLTSGVFRVLAGQSLTLTYSVAPTWVWLGE